MNPFAEYDQYRDFFVGPAIDRLVKVIDDFEKAKVHTDAALRAARRREEP